MKDLLAMDLSSLSQEERRCHNALSNRTDALQAFLTNTFDYEKRHKVIIERFGRYPHRNPALGRKSTPEEIEYLENGGDTFGQISSDFGICMQKHLCLYYINRMPRWTYVVLHIDNSPILLAYAVGQMLDTSTLHSRLWNATGIGN